MNTNEHDSDPRERISRLLVATLLGEATAGEAAEVEQALQSDPELRAERETLEATIGLVRGLDAGAGERLSPEATAALIAAAERRGATAPQVGGGKLLRGPWSAGAAVRLAASVAVLASAFALWRIGQGTTAPATENLAARYEVFQDADGGEVIVARLDEEQVGRSRGLRSNAPREREEQLSAGGGAGAVRGQAPLGEPAPDASPTAPEELARRSDDLSLGVPGTESERGAGAPAASAPAAPELAFPPLAVSEPEIQLGQEVALLGKREKNAQEQADLYHLGRSASAEAPAPTSAPSELAAVLDGPAPARDRFDDAKSVVSFGAAAGARPSSSGPGSPGPAGAKQAEGRPEVAARRLRIAPPASEPSEFHLGQDGFEAAGEDPLLRDSDVLVEVAQGAAVLDELRAIGYAQADADTLRDVDRQLRESLQGLGYLGSDDREEGDQPKDRLGAGYERARRYLEARQLSPEQRSASIDQLLASCRRRPSERPRDMFYRYWGDNPFEVARLDPLSTFSIDVDTASYTLARRYLAERRLPEKAQIRTEEFVNYFKGDVPPPSEATFGIETELAPSLFDASPDTWMLRVAVRGKEVARDERKPLALTFVVDVSGSMKEQNRLELVKHAMRLLVGELDARDAISLVAFSKEARLVLPMTSARNRGLIESAIHPLQPEGGTNVQAGLRMGYEAALATLAPEAGNRVVLLSDGVGNIGETDAEALNREVQHARDRGIYLNTVGVGMNNHNDAFLEQLADTGDGICNYVDDEHEARRALVENFTGAFEPIARDVKIQVEFDPAQVERYRLLGYENRAIADQDFRNDAVDAGEVGAGHQVVALYELVRTGHGDASGPLATVRLRWLQPFQVLAANQFVELPATEVAHPVHAGDAAGSFGATSAGYRRSVLVAQLAEFLRRSIHAREDSLEVLLGEARKLAPQLADPDFDEFVQMIERTVELLSVEWGRYDALARRLDALRMQHYLRAQLEDLEPEPDRARLEQLDRQCRELEDEIRQLLQTQVRVRAR